MTIDLIFSKLNNDLSWIKDNTIFLTAHGSVAYGLSTPESDKDYRGCFVPTKEYLLGFNKKIEQFDIKDPDTTIFEIRKFFNLCAQNNPNCLELLFTDEEFHYIKTKTGQKLLDNRDKFLSKLVKERYIGYARAQAHRIKNHKHWIDSPRTAPPTREEFGLPKELSIPKDQYLTVNALIQKKIDNWNCNFEEFSDAQKIYLQGKVSQVLTEMSIGVDETYQSAARQLGYNENFILLLNKEKSYQSKLEDYKNYLQWIKNRNPKRAELERKCGYDSKHACQLIRLLKLGKEILLTSKVQLKRTDDREELLSIKQGNWKYEDVISYADKLQDEVEQNYHTSKLQSKPNINELDNLCIELVEEFL